MTRKVKQHRQSSRRKQRGPSRLRGATNDWRLDRIHDSTAVAGPDIVSASVDEVLLAMERAPRGDDWEAVRPLVIPMIPRVRPLPPGSVEGLRVLLPPGLHVGFGVDIGPACLSVTPRQLDILGISEAELVTSALGNLMARAAQIEPRSVVRQSVDGMPVVALQTGLHVGSTLVLVPDEIGRVVGREPRLFVAPMRDVLLGFPVAADAEVIGLLYEEIASQDPNCLPPIAFRFDGEQIRTASLAAEVPASRRLLA